MPIITNEKIEDLAHEVYCECSWGNNAEHTLRMDTKLKVTHDLDCGILRITIRNPTLHNRLFRCSLNVDDPVDESDVHTNTLCPHDERDTFEEMFMTRLVDWIQDGDFDDFD